MTYTEYKRLFQKCGECVNINTCNDDVCADCACASVWEKGRLIVCPDCGEPMTFASGEAVNSPEYVCFVCGYNHKKII